jgi:two-component system, OmpR family, phosphate regulon sensor histidine kinase PhoR
VKLGQRAKGFLTFLGMITFLSLTFAAMHYLTGWIYRITGVTPAPVLVQVINSVGGLLLMGMTIGVLSQLFRPRLRASEIAVVGPILEALERIAKGDFSVRVEPDRDPHAPGMLSELANSVNRAAVQLYQMETLRQEFISNVSHELQSPLTSIQGFTRALHNDALSPLERKHYLQIIVAESTRLSRITENLLKLASLEGDHVKFKRRKYRLDRQVRGLILACEPQWVGKSLEMDVNIDEVTISADEDLLSQVWINLIHNAIKFTPEGGRIRITLCQQDEGSAFEIEDSGIGISADDQKRIFERFYKADPSRSHSTNEGSGLGLSIVQRIVNMHQGSINVISESGAGACFTVTLPAE